MRYQPISMWDMAADAIALRQKILHACERRLGSQHALADRFGVSLWFGEKLLRRHRLTGDLAPKPHAGGQRPRRDAAANTLIRRFVHDHTAVTLEALCARVADELGVRVRLATRCRVLQRLGLPRQNRHSTRARAIPRVSSQRARITASGSRRSPSGA
jgi:transposase